MISNKSDKSIKCIPDIQAMTGHILPLLSYALQLYVISKLFYFTGNYSHILTDIFWIIALFVFVIIAIGVHGSSCLHSNTSFTIASTGLLQVGFVMLLVKRSHSRNTSHENHNTNRHQRVITNNQDNTTTITNTIS